MIYQCPDCGKKYNTEKVIGFCMNCGAELNVVSGKSVKPVRHNRTDEKVKDVLRSKSFRIYWMIIFFFVCLIPGICLCLGLMGVGPLTQFLNSLF